MPILSAIGRKHPRTRLLIAGIYCVLGLGAATMIYPLLLMISGSFKSAVDGQTWDLIPRYFFDDTMLFRKFTESKYNESVSQANMTHRTAYFGFEFVELPTGLRLKAVADWEEFLTSTKLPDDYKTLGFVQGFRIL